MWLARSPRLQPRRSDRPWRKAQCFVAACTLPRRSSSWLSPGALRQERPLDTEEVHIRVTATPEEQERCKSSAGVVMCVASWVAHTPEAVLSCSVFADEYMNR